MREDITKADQKTALQHLTAPVDGAVQQLSVHTVGGILTPAQQPLVVVPQDSAPEIEAMISNRDIVPLTDAAAADSRKVNLFSVGRLSAEKGLSYLIQAVDELVNRTGMDVTLRMGGKGPEENSLKQEVARRGLEERVQFLGYIPDGELLAAYRASDVFMLPSLTEGLPQALLEAMACGVPVVASRVGGIPHLITDGENGLLVTPTDVSQLTRAVCQLVGDRALRERIRENGGRTAREHTMETEVARVVAVLRDCFPTLSF